MTASCFDGIETSAGTQSLVLRVQKQTALKYEIAIQLNRIMVQKSGTRVWESAVWKREADDTGDAATAASRLILRGIQ